MTFATLEKEIQIEPPNTVGTAGKLNTMIAQQANSNIKATWAGTVNGKGLFSMFLPDDLIYSKKNNADPNEPVVRIYRGVLLEGTIDKSIIGSSHDSLIQLLYKEYSVFTDKFNPVNNLNNIDLEEKHLSIHNPSIFSA